MSKTSINFQNVTTQDLTAMTEKSFDTLPFGTIMLDRHGTVKVFNQWEATLARRKQASVIGKSFFRDIAPCTDVAEFRGRLDEMSPDGMATQLFDFVFDFAWGKRAVRVRFMVNSIDERWVFVTDVT
jgi:photoactive yellow protein